MWPKNSRYFRRAEQNKKPTNSRKFAQSGHPGVNLMITIFCDFRQFSAKKIGAFLKTNVMHKLLQKTSSSLSIKRQFFWRKYFLKNKTSVPVLQQRDDSW
jgi:hypothetical protein